MATLTFLKGGGVGGEDEDDSFGDFQARAVNVLGVLLFFWVSTLLHGARIQSMVDVST